MNGPSLNPIKLGDPLNDRVAIAEPPVSRHRLRNTVKGAARVLGLIDMQTT